MPPFLGLVWLSLYTLVPRQCRNSPRPAEVTEPARTRVREPRCTESGNPDTVVKPLSKHYFLLRVAFYLPSRCGERGLLINKHALQELIGRLYLPMSQNSSGGGLEGVWRGSGGGLEGRSTDLPSRYNNKHVLPAIPVW
eukprot:376498-Prorocentrum_minimum.AAC.9